MSKIDILIGAQWGDEGKGKWVDYLCPDFSVIARFQGGNNAGHTIYVDGEKQVLHLLPSGVFHDKLCVLLSGVVIDPIQLLAEIDAIRKTHGFTDANLIVSEKAHAITPFHVAKDISNEKKSNKIGTTKKGIGPSYGSKVSRTGLSMVHYIDKTKREAWIKEMIKSDPAFQQNYEEDKADWQKFIEAADQVKVYVKNAEAILRKKTKAGASLLLEGAQGALLDINHGTYPYVTSSSTIAAGACASLGIDPRKLNKICGVAKAYATRVGEGPFPTELFDSIGDMIREKGQEYGATTKRKRRCGWFDGLAFKYAVDLNGFDGVYLNKVDILGGMESIKLCTHYEHPILGVLHDFPSSADTLSECVPSYETLPGWDSDLSKCKTKKSLPKTLLNYVERIEELGGAKVLAVGTGPGPSDFINL